MKKRTLFLRMVFIFLGLFLAYNFSLNFQFQAVAGLLAGEKETPDSQTPVVDVNTQISQDDRDYSRQRISLSLRNIDIHEALKFFSYKSGMNIVPTQRVTGRITLNVENALVKDVFDIMLRSNNLAYDKKGDIYNVMTEAEYKQLYGKAFSDTRQVMVFRLKYAIPEQAFNLLEAVKSDIGRLLTEPESGAIMLIDTPEKIKEAQKALEALEEKSNIKIFNLQYARAKDVEEQLKTQLDLKKVGTIKAYERNNQVMVQTLPERMKDIEELVKSLDKKTQAVLIDVKIIKIKLSDQKDTGIQWEGLFEMAKKYGMAYIGSYPFSVMNAGITNPSFKTRYDYWQQNPQIGAYPFSGTTSSLNASQKINPGKMHVGIVGTKSDFDALVKYLQTLGKSKIIASPSLSCVNNQEAKIHIGERRAYITTTTTTGTTTSTVSEEVTYVDVGVRLSVTPMINEDGYVIMKVRPEISSVIGNVVSSSNNIVPIIDTNVAETTVMAKNGTTVIIGGLGREEKAEDSQGVPLLSRVPFLGTLFRNSTAKMERVELIIMLTPVIYEGDKFLTPRDVNKFEHKPAKKFDVFKPEALPQNQIPSLLVPFSDGLVSKGVKSYEEVKTAIKDPEEEKLKGVFSEEQEGFVFKGRRSYN